MLYKFVGVLLDANPQLGSSGLKEIKIKHNDIEEKRRIKERIESKTLLERFSCISSFNLFTENPIILLILILKIMKLFSWHLQQLLYHQL